MVLLLEWSAHDGEVLGSDPVANFQFSREPEAQSYFIGVSLTS